MPGDALDALLGLARPVRFVCGNGDRELVAAFDGASDPASLPPDWAELQRWAAGRLTRSQRDALAGFEATVVLAIDVLGATRFCHGSPRRDDELLTSATPAGTVAEACAGVAESVVVCGHTHVQFDRRIEASRLVNAGSVGLPYEGRPGASGRCSGPTSRSGARPTTSTGRSSESERRAARSSRRRSSRLCSTRRARGRRRRRSSEPPDANPTRRGPEPRRASRGSSGFPRPGRRRSACRARCTSRPRSRAASSSARGSPRDARIRTRS